MQNRQGRAGGGAHRSRTSLGHQPIQDRFWGYVGFLGVALLALCALGEPSKVIAAGVVGNGTPDSCTEAALDAALAGGGLVTFDCGLDPATIAITSTKTISVDTTIDGGHLVTISGGHSVPVFDVNPGVTFTVHNLTIANGSAAGSITGGGIFNGGTLTVTNSTFSGNNSSEDICGDFLCGGQGGAINNGGGGTVTNSTFSGNSASVGGGGIYNTGTLTVTNSTFSDNNASGSTGGAIFNDGGGTLTVTNSTFSGNSASVGGGGIDNGSGGTLTVTNSIIANSTNGGDCSGSATDGGHNLIGDAENSCGLVDGVNGNIVGVDPLLDPDGPQNNGGPTETIALLDGSPAVDAGDPEVCANPPVNSRDQRGYRRPGTGSAVCSIGAYEYKSPGPCAGDCDGSGDVTSADRVTLLGVALGTSNLNECLDGDWTGDGAVTVDEIILAVNATPDVCPAFTPEQRCLASGGAVTTGICCLSVGDFPDTCGIGACSCAPGNSHEVRVCACDENRCWDGQTCAPRVPPLSRAP
jgi:predicted outer membrane repeat protein